MPTNRSTLPQAGHTPGDLRSAFEEAVEDRDELELRRLAGLLWSCTDTMPAGICDLLEVPLGSSYAQAARVIRS